MSHVISFDEIKTRHFCSIKWFLNDLCATNNEGERPTCDVYRKELKFTIKHQGDHATVF